MALTGNEGWPLVSEVKVTVTYIDEHAGDEHAGNGIDKPLGPDAIRGQAPEGLRACTVRKCGHPSCRRSTRCNDAIRESQPAPRQIISFKRNRMFSF